MMLDHQPDAGSPKDELGMKVQVNVICEGVAGDSMGTSA